MGLGYKLLPHYCSPEAQRCDVLELLKRSSYAPLENRYSAWHQRSRVQRGKLAIAQFLVTS